MEIKILSQFNNKFNTISIVHDEMNECCIELKSLHYMEYISKKSNNLKCIILIIEYCIYIYI